MNEKIRNIDNEAMSLQMIANVVDISLELDSEDSLQTGGFC